MSDWMIPVVTSAITALGVMIVGLLSYLGLRRGQRLQAQEADRRIAADREASRSAPYELLAKRVEVLEARVTTLEGERNEALTARDAALTQRDAALVEVETMRSALEALRTTLERERVENRNYIKLLIEAWSNNRVLPDPPDWFQVPTIQPEIEEQP